MLFSRQQYVAVEFDIFHYKGITGNLFHTSRQIFSKSAQLRLQSMALGHVAPPSTRMPSEPSRAAASPHPPWRSPPWRLAPPSGWTALPQTWFIPSLPPPDGCCDVHSFLGQHVHECLPAAQHALGTQDTAEDKGTGSLPWGGPHSRRESCCAGEGHGCRPPPGTVCQAEAQAPRQCLAVHGGPSPQAPAFVLHVIRAHTVDEVGQLGCCSSPASGGRPRAPEMAMPGSVPPRRLWLSIPSPAHWPVLQWCWMTWQRQATCDFKGRLSATDFLKDTRHPILQLLRYS